MNTLTIRNEQFERLSPKMQESLCEVLQAWRAHGPGTTADVAEKAGLNLLTLRPRTCDLKAMGLVRLQGRCKVSHSGIYRLATEAEMMADFRAASEARATGQLSMKLNA